MNQHGFVNYMEEISGYLRTLSSVPNVPFFPNPIRTNLLNIVRGIIKDYPKGRVSLLSDSYGLYIRFRPQNDNNRKMVFISHLDHPGIVFSSKRIGYPLGNLISNGNRELIDLKDYCIRLYSPRGDFLGNSSAELNGGRFKLQGKWSIPNNTVGIWDIPDLIINNENIYMRSCDNLVSASILLTIVSSIVKSSIDCDVSFVFTWVEEIMQLSMVNIATAKMIPTTKFDSSTVFINLDVSEAVHDQKVTFPYTRRKISPTLFVQLSDGDIHFSVPSKNALNLSEILLKNASEKSQIPIHIGEFRGKSDAFPLALYTKYSNIVSLLIPCENTHNINNLGNISPEVVKTQHVKDAFSLIWSVVKSHGRLPNTILSSAIPNQFYQNENVELKKYKAKWKSTSYVNRVRLRREFFFPNNFLDFTLLLYGKFQSIMNSLLTNFL